VLDERKVVLQGRHDFAPARVGRHRDVKLATHGGETGAVHDVAVHQVEFASKLCEQFFNSYFIV
jgi:hypothetical protein